MYILILIFPLIGFILSGSFGKYFGRLGSAYLSTLSLFLTLLLSIIFFYEICLCKSVINIKLYSWILLDIFSIDIGFLFDTVSVTMIFIISTISFFVHLYSNIYMSHDPHLSRFMSYLSLFTFFMLILVTSDNFFQLFLGWEGVGLCSYLLINFWYTRILANKASLKAMVMNRIADVFFVLGIILLFLIFKTTDYYLIFNLLPYIYNENIYFLNIFVKKIDLIAFFLFIGSIGKSAQIGFHTWLPDAMEGPTPVSALLHAATMVTAGVFLIIRASLIFEYSSKVLILLIIFGTITALFSSMIAVFQYDIKKIIAYSTCSQLGYMFFSCGLSNYNVAFFHLFNHAFFKSLLFLSAGVLIHSLFDEQDIRKMGNLIYILNFVYFAILIGSLAILGFPFLSGFYSKDLILELVYSRYIFDSIYIYLMSLIAALFTSIYSLKIIFYVFFHKINTNYIIYDYFMKNKVEVWNLMYISLFFLVILSIISGYLFSDMFIGYGSLFWNNSIHQFYYNYIFIDVEFMHPIIKNLPIILCFFVMCILYLLLSNIYYIKYIYIYYNIYIYIASFFYYGLFFNKIYNKIYNNIYFYSYTVTNKYLDKGLLEILGPFGIYKLFFYLNKKIIYMVSSLIYIYIFFFLFSLFMFFILLILINFVNISFIINNLFIIIFFILSFFCFNKIEKIK